MEQDFSKVAVEVNSIMENMSIEILKKIPEKVQNLFKENASKTYTFSYDKTKSLEEQEIMDKTRGVIALLYRDYICDENEKKEFNSKYIQYINEKEEEKRKLYGEDIIFKKVKNNIETCTSNKLTVVEKKESLIKVIFNKILRKIGICKK